MLELFSNPDSCADSGRVRTAARFQFRARHRGGKTHGPRSVQPRNDDAARHAAHRHHVCRHRLFLERLEARLFCLGRHNFSGSPSKSSSRPFAPASSAGTESSHRKSFHARAPHAEIENLFSNLPLIAGALAAVGLLIIYAGLREEKSPRHSEIQPQHSVWIGLVQGFCLPFRGFSRSGSTISTGLMLGLPKQKLEEFSFALAVVLTPPSSRRKRIGSIKAHALSGSDSVLHLFVPGLVGMVFSFIAGLLALKWLSRWLEGGRWKFFGFYCLLAAAGVLLDSLQTAALTQFGKPRQLLLETITLLRRLRKPNLLSNLQMIQVQPRICIPHLFHRHFDALVLMRFGNGGTDAPLPAGGPQLFCLSPGCVFEWRGRATGHSGEPTSQTGSP